MTKNNDMWMYVIQLWKFRFTFHIYIHVKKDYITCESVKFSYDVISLSRVKISVHIVVLTCEKANFTCDIFVKEVCERNYSKYSGSTWKLEVKVMDSLVIISLCTFVVCLTCRLCHVFHVIVILHNWLIPFQTQYIQIC